uniref:Protein atonal homolog 8 n=2 Tax=Leptobrachium leishanense TaxID=445787 RepID=A0A8C5M0K2_9ANUR
MRSPPHEEPWRGSCMKRRRSRARGLTDTSGSGGFKVLDVKLEEEAGVVGAARGSPAGASAHRLGAGEDVEDDDEEELLVGGCPGALDLRSGAVVAAKRGLLKAGALEGIGVQRLQPRMLLCHRPPEPPYMSPEDPDSPRTRLGDPSGVSPEIKALQQTRRLLANARERTRVHTISAAFEALRKQVPCYSYGQKLSKLAILRIACNYILSLARLADLDYSADHGNLSFSECVEQCTRTLQSEGRSKKRKELQRIYL